MNLSAVFSVWRLHCYGEAACLDTFLHPLRLSMEHQERTSINTPPQSVAYELMAFELRLK